jgi:hypothetical protein
MLARIIALAIFGIAAAAPVPEEQANEAAKPGVPFIGLGAPLLLGEAALGAAALGAAGTGAAAGLLGGRRGRPQVIVVPSGSAGPYTQGPQGPYRPS